MKNAWQRLKEAWANLPRSTKLLLAALLLVGNVALWYVGLYLPAQVAEAPTPVPSTQVIEAPDPAPRLPGRGQATGRSPGPRGGPGARFFPRGGPGAPACPRGPGRAPAPEPLRPPGGGNPTPTSGLRLPPHARPRGARRPGPDPRPSPPGGPRHPAHPRDLRRPPGAQDPLPRAVRPPAPGQETPPKVAVPTALVEAPLPGPEEKGAEKAPTPASPLERLVAEKGLRLSGTLLGPVSVAILESKEGYLVVPAGSPIPGTEAVVRQVEEGSVTLALKEETLSLSLVQAGGGQ